MGKGEQTDAAFAQVHDAEPTLERQVELHAAYETNEQANRRPYAGVAFRTRAEVLWVMQERNWSNDNGQAADFGNASLRHLNLAGLQLYCANLEATDLFGAILSRTMLSKANLTGADLSSANLTHANLTEAVCIGARFQEAELEEAHLSSANLRGTHFFAADLSSVWLDDADLSSASLEGANLSGANLRDANLSGAELQGADMRGADIRHARMDAMTRLAHIQLDANTLLSDVSWNGAPLTLVRWGTVPLLGDEVQARRTHRLAEFDSAVRANRQLAVALRSQGLNEQADDYAYRAHVLRKSVLWRQALSPREDLLWKELAAIPPSLQGEGNIEMITEEVGRVGVWQRMGSLIAYVGSWLLDLLAGYGYRPGRAILLYLAVIIWFANFYVWASHGLITLGLPPSHVQPLAWYEGLILSVSSFHGRGFQPFQNLNDPVAALAGIQAVLGLVIEVSFIATFTQRFFGK